ncbi:MAG: MFS transporter [Thermodesulfobacteriota bacterium]|nr:MFS transporter [Deltaproteobacteria bacterium TMED58]|tara:strand:- start:10417 stop:11589 length:1173 start_codon:yes stop_codon:yes gene_type:complete
MSFTTIEKKATTVVSLILSLRLLGLFMLLPIFSIYAIEYESSSIFLAGIAIGIYSLAQAIMQVPLAYLSDKLGRKKIVLFGLFLFTIGSLICFFSSNINMLIIGRIIQGCGAISSVGVATLSENTSKDNRASAFTIVGLSVGIAFVIGFLIGPIISSIFNFRILFLLLFFFGILAIVTTIIFYPEKINTSHDKIDKKEFRFSKDIIKIYLASFMLSLILSIFLFIYPLFWQSSQSSEVNLSLVYLIIFLPAAIFIYPSIRYLEKKNKIDLAIMSGWVLLLIGFIYFLLLGSSEMTLYILGTFFFLGITIFQSVLPSLLSLYVSEKMRATGTGPYYIFSFLGHAIGSISAGYIYSKELVLGQPVSFILILAITLILVVWMKIGVPNYQKRL